MILSFSTLAGLFFAAIVVTAILCVRHLQKEAFVTQYVFFLRFPLLLGAAAFIGPVLAPRFAGALASNAFVVGSIGAGCLVFFATISAWAIVYNFTLIYYSIPIRNKLYYRRKVQDGTHTPKAIPLSLLGRKQGIFAEVIVAPLAIVLICKGDGFGWLARIWAVVAVIAGNVIAFFIVQKLAERVIDHALVKVTSLFPANSRAARTLGWVSDLLSAHREGLVPRALPQSHLIADTNFKRLHRRAAAFAVISVGIYLLLGLAFILPVNIREEIPALTYLMALFLVIIWVLGWLSLKFDVYRVPVFTLLAGFLLIWYELWPHGHRYPVHELAPNPDVLKDSNLVLDRFLSAGLKPNSDPKFAQTLVLVAASGGGITAEYWSAIVLDGLQRELLASVPGFDFNSRVALVSSVSGGSVGCMYYLDALRDPDSEKMQRLVDTSGLSTLSAVTWGLAYPDFVRVFAGEPLTGSYDRGWSLERRWSRNVASLDSPLCAWAEGLGKPGHPIPVFNATIEETGERLALSPVALEDEDGRIASDFNRSMQRRNVSVVTAARLSASFPFIAPRALPDPGSSMANSDFHSADGGYFDNSGVFSALSVTDRWLRHKYPDVTRSTTLPNGEHTPKPSDSSENGSSPIHESAQRPVPIRIVLIEISAFAPEKYKGKTTVGDSVVSELIGPVITLYSVRSATQDARKRFELDAITDLWRKKYGVTLIHSQFYLVGDSPLSWQLTDKERDMIRTQWPGYDPRIADPDSHIEPKEVARPLNEVKRELASLAASTSEAVRKSIDKYPLRELTPSELEGRAANRKTLEALIHLLQSPLAATSAL